jgi:hypothetical protein
MSWIDQADGIACRLVAGPGADDYRLEASLTPGFSQDSEFFAGQRHRLHPYAARRLFALEQEVASLRRCTEMQAETIADDLRTIDELNQRILLLGKQRSEQAAWNNAALAKANEATNYHANMAEARRTEIVRILADRDSSAEGKGNPEDRLDKAEKAHTALVRACEEIVKRLVGAEEVLGKVVENQAEIVPVMAQLGERITEQFKVVLPLVSMETRVGNVERWLKRLDPVQGMDERSRAAEICERMAESMRTEWARRILLNAAGTIRRNDGTGADNETEGGGLAAEG